jgi:hypothetical protein
MVTDQMPYANRMLDAQVMHDIIQGIPPVRAPPLGTLVSKPSLKRFWDLTVAMWQRDPKRRPDILAAGRMLAECRSNNTGPQLTAHSATASASPSMTRIHTMSSNTIGGPSSGTISANDNHVPGPTNTPRTTISSRVSTSTISTYRRDTSRESVSRRTRTSSASPIPLFSSGRLSRSTSLTSRKSSTGQKELVSRVSPHNETLFSPTVTTVVDDELAQSQGNEDNGNHIGGFSNPLNQLRRSSSLIMKGAFGGSLRRPTSFSTRSNFQPAINAYEQVWSDT